MRRWIPAVFVGRQEDRASSACRPGLGGHPPGTQAQARHADDPLERVYRPSPGRVSVFPVLRALPGLGGRLSVTMRQAHRAGNKLFVDYAGDTIAVVIDRLTGRTRPAQLFVAVLGASSFLYADALHGSYPVDRLVVCRSPTRRPNEPACISCQSVRPNRSVRLSLDLPWHSAQWPPGGPISHFHSCNLPGHCDRLALSGMIIGVMPQRSEKEPVRNLDVEELEQIIARCARHDMSAFVLDGLGPFGLHELHPPAGL